MDVEWQSKLAFIDAMEYYLVIEKWVIFLCKEMKKYPRHIMKWKKKTLPSDLSGLFSFSMCQSTEVRVWALDPDCLHSCPAGMLWAHSSASLVLVLTFLGLVPWQCLLPKATLIIRWLKHSQAVQLLSHVQLFATPWTAACQASLSITNSWRLLKFMSIELVVSSNHLIPFSFFLQTFPASGSFPVSQFFASGSQSIGV